MNWFDTSGLTSLAKTALKEAQKTIDKALDIQDESGEELEQDSVPQSSTKSSPKHENTSQKDNADFFASWGLTMSAESVQGDTIKEQPVVTASPTKSTPQTIWGSFAGSFFEQPQTEDATIVRPPKAKSMNVIADGKYDSQDDLFSKSQLIMSDSETLDHRIVKSGKDETPAVDERRDSGKSNRLSLVSSRNSSDSVEVLSQSLKTTPDSEVSVHSMSRSSSAGLKHNSESVEILPDSLVSPSSIECLGFDSCSEKNSNSSSMCLSPEDTSDKKLTPVGERNERADTADSVSLVADDDEDTMSYNSISECTAPTVLDTDDKPVSPFSKLVKTDGRKCIEKEFIHLEQAILPHRMQISENSSNDGSWSDRTLNADNDSITLEGNIDEQKQEDMLIDKLSDSSSFYNVTVSNDMLRSDSLAFVNIEKQQCNESSSGSSNKEGSVKERTSPISSDSKSDLVKIGSDRTSGHTSGDELETATSSDIEIIPSPNGDSHGCRNSPAKYTFKQSKFDGSTSPNLVDLVLGKSLATKIRGHNRELSEASVQSNTSDESQGSENERLMRRLCEMAEILEARENRLMEVSRNNAELVETNTELKNQVESLMSKHEVGDINTITEDYTQRMSALEKKFQQAIREKDQLRKQLDVLKSETSARKNSELESSIKEKDEVILQLQEEGEKLARQQLQHSNIIKRLRAKEKDNEQVIKGLRDKISEQTNELDRLKRSIAAKEELEVSQIEAVYRLTTANKKIETELIETRSVLDDTSQKLEVTRTSLESARRELSELQRNNSELTRKSANHSHAQEMQRRADAEVERLRAELHQLRIDTVNEEKKWVVREESLRAELREAREQLSSVEVGGASAGAGPGGGAGAVLQQLAQLQRAALHREQTHRGQLAQIQQQHVELERSLTSAVERERLSREECVSLQARLLEMDEMMDRNRRELNTRTEREQQLLDNIQLLEKELHSKNTELISLQSENSSRLSELEHRVRQLDEQLVAERSALDTEKKRNAILQEQISSRGDVSPPHSVTSDSLSASLWQSEECGGSPVCGRATSTTLCVEDSLHAALARREGELRAAATTRELLLAERTALTTHLARLQDKLTDYQSVQEQYDALLQMYGEKEEQLAELRLDLQDVTALYKAQLHELVALKQTR